MLKLGRLLLFGESLLLVATTLYSALGRFRYPYSLDWIEEGNLVEVDRLVHHLPIYTAPTIHYTPYIYAPLFYWVAAWMTRVVGVGYPALRLVSILSMIGTFAGVFAFVARETPRRSPSRWLSAALATGLFATAYTVTAGFLDVGRVDMLCLAFFVWVSFWRGGAPWWERHCCLRSRSRPSRGFFRLPC